MPTTPNPREGLTVTLTAEQAELIRRAMLNAAAVDLQHAITEIEHLATVAPWPPVGARSSDAQNAVAIAREGLDILDVIGWPRDETREEWEAHMSATTKEA